MTQKTIKNFVLFFAAALFVLGGCEKEELVLSDDGAEIKSDNESRKEETLNEQIYILNDTQVNRNDINFENDELMLIHGAAKNKNEVLVFECRENFYSWAETQTDTFTQQLVKAVKDADKARAYAEEMGEFEKKETSPEFKKFLKDNFSKTTKIGFGKLYEGYNRTGWSYLMGSIPIARLKGNYDNAASSIEVTARWYVLYDKTYWRGWLESYGHSVWGWWNISGSANNKTSSVWTI